jgi:6-pyruvoyltetrahydropterin/6-carboxytetrahydropterin synthase
MVTRAKIITKHDMKISKSFSFSMGHRIPLHKGKCSNFHGHNYDIEIMIGFKMDSVQYFKDEGYFVDFGDLKKYVDDRFDHKFLMQSTDPFLPALNDQKIPGLVVVDYSPSAENIAIDIASGIRSLIASKGYDNTAFDISVDLLETKSSRVVQHC